MFWRNMLACLFVLLPVAATAQQTPPAAQPANEVEQLKAKLDTALRSLADLTAQVEKNTQAIDNNLTLINEVLEKQRQLRESLEDLRQTQQEQFVQQQQVLDAIAQPDSSGNNVLRLSAAMESSPEFREDVRQAVHDSLAQEGTLILHNKMATTQEVTINRQQHSIPAGEVLTLKVPVGTLTAQLPGQRITNWTIAAPTYEQRIDVVPDTSATVTALRPLTGTSATATTTFRPLTESSVLPAPVTTFLVSPAPVYVDVPRVWYVWP